MQPAIGDTFGRYHLEALVGEGGMGRVFRAFDTTLQRRVAIKILRAPRPVDGEVRVDRVLREARAAAALDHPGVVAVFDVGEANGQPFIVMEYVVGRSLRALIGVAEVPADERLRWLVDIARSLAAAHRAGLVHRDIKPENVMLRGDGAVKLLDFGIARQLEDDAAATAALSGPETGMAGTPAYMAPEQVQRRPVDARADQFGWGVLAYELLTGALPWRGPQDGVPLAIAVVTEVQAPVAATSLGLPERVAAVIDRALAKAPAQRFASMDALVLALVGEAPRWTTAAHPAATTGADTTPTGRADTPVQLESEPSPAPRRRLAFGLAGLGVAGAVTLAALQLRRAPDPPEPAPPDEPAWTASGPAQAAYEEGRRRVRSAALHAGIEGFQDAIEYEPEFAAAQLRLALVRLIDGPYPAPAEPYHAAVRLRRRLGASDQGLLDAVAPAFDREVPALDEVIEGLKRLAARFPGDAELRLYVPLALSLRGRDDEAAPLLHALLADDPGNATAWLTLAYIHLDRDEPSEARDALERCRAAAPDAVDCLWLGIKIDAFAGRCEAMEQGAIAWQRLKPDDHGAATVRVDALIAQGRPADEIAAIEAEMWAGHRGDLREASERINTATRRILAGDLRGGDQVLAGLDGEVGVSAYERLWIGELRIAVLAEQGDLAGAAAIARALRLRKRSLPGNGYVADDGILADPTPILDRTLLAAGELSAEEFAARRRTWFGEWRTRGGGHHEPELWLRGHAGPARTAADAREAIAALPAGEPIRRFLYDRLLIVDTARVHLLAGQPADAIPLLRTAAASCLAADEPVRYVQAHALLGDALAATGDVPGACDAYAAVLARWGAATPRSVTAEAAASRRVNLGCAGAAG